MKKEEALRQAKLEMIKGGKTGGSPHLRYLMGNYGRSRVVDIWK